MARRQARAGKTGGLGMRRSLLARAFLFSMVWAIAVVHLPGCPRQVTPDSPRRTGGHHVSSKKDLDGGDERPVAKGQRAWDALGELARMQTIAELWNAQNQAQDRLGQALVRLERPARHRVDREPRTRNVPGDDRPRLGVPTQAPVHRWSQRGQEPSLCRDVCRHVVAICYASRRICAIASRLGDWAARQACARAADRCQDAQRAARSRCARCPGT